MIHRFTAADWVTLSRVVFVGYLVLTIFLQWWLQALAMVCLIAVSDIGDGILARRRRKTSYGGLLDAGVDKLKIAFWVTLLVTQTPPPLIFWTIVVYIGVQLKLILLAAVGLWLKKRFSHITLEANPFGKIKFTLELLAATFFILGLWKSDPIFFLLGISSWRSDPILGWVGTILLLGAIMSGIGSIIGHSRAVRDQVKRG